MALGDGIRRNIAMVSQGERDRLRNAFLKLDTQKFYQDGVSYWDKQEDIHKGAHAAGADVHDGPAFLPWHRELCNRLEALLREVDPQLSLHYWDWTTDPRATSDGVGGTVDLFTPQFMGSSQGDAGPPLQDFESTEPGHTHIWRQVAGGNSSVTPPPVDSDNTIVTAGDTQPQGNQFDSMRQVLQNSHNNAHGYIGGSIGFQHFSFHDPFVFLLHSNVDRLWAMWQTAPGKGWRLDPAQVYGVQGTAASINADLEPWAGNSGLRPWAPPENLHETKNCLDPSVVTPPRYDTTTVVPAHWSEWESLGGVLTSAPAAASWQADRLDSFVTGTDSAMWHKWWDGSSWSGWESQGGICDEGVAVASWQAGRLDCFVIGTDSAMWHKWWDGSSWSGWESLGGICDEGVAVASWQADRLDCFVIGTDSAMWHKWWDGSSWSEWESLGGICTSAPTAVSWGPNRIDTFVRGTDSAMWHKWWNGSSWSGWESLGGICTSAPAVASWQADRLDCFVRGTDDAMWHKWWDGSFWSGWESLGGVLTSAPTAVSWSPDRIDTFVRGTDSAMWHKWWG